ncbi:MAG: hypothetical protein AAB551_03650 [Patescibacteria group bacterium]
MDHRDDLPLLAGQDSEDVLNVSIGFPENRERVALLEDWLGKREGRIGAATKLANILDGIGLTAFRTLPNILRDGVKDGVREVLDAVGGIMPFRPELLVQDMLHKTRTMHPDLIDFLNEHEKVLKAVIEAMPRWENGKGTEQKPEKGRVANIFQKVVIAPVAKGIKDMRLEEKDKRPERIKSITECTDVELLKVEPSGEEVLQDERLALLLNDEKAQERYLKELFSLEEADNAEEQLASDIQMYLQSANKVHEKRVVLLYPTEPETQQKLQWSSAVQEAKSYRELWKLIQCPGTAISKTKGSDKEEERDRKRIRKEAMLKLAYCTLLARVLRSRQYQLRKPIAAYLSELILTNHVQDQKFEYGDVYFDVQDGGIDLSETEKFGYQKTRVVKCNLIGRNIETNEPIGPIEVYFYPGRDENDGSTMGEENFNVINIKAAEVMILKTIIKDESHPMNLRDPYRSTVFAKRKEDQPTAEKILENGLLNLPNRVKGKSVKNRATSSSYDKAVDHATVEISISKERLAKACRVHGISRVPQYNENTWLEMRYGNVDVLLERCADQDPSHGIYKILQLLRESEISMPSDLYPDHWLLRFLEATRKIYRQHAAVDKDSVVSRLVEMAKTEGIERIAARVKKENPAGRILHAVAALRKRVRDEVGL